jgi:hypothetical protein
MALAPFHCPEMNEDTATTPFNAYWLLITSNAVIYQLWTQFDHYPSAHEYINAIEDSCKRFPKVAGVLRFENILPNPISAN